MNSFKDNFEKKKIKKNEKWSEDDSDWRMTTKD